MNVPGEMRIWSDGGEIVIWTASLCLKTDSIHFSLSTDVFLAQWSFRERERKKEERAKKEGESQANNPRHETRVSFTKYWSQKIHLNVKRYAICI